MRLFSQKGFHGATIPLLAKELKMSVGNIYNYFPSKINLAKSAIRFASGMLASSLRKINKKDISSKEKVELFVRDYIEIVRTSPEVIEFFLRVYLSNRDLFDEEESGGFKLAEEFVNEVQTFIRNGIRDSDFKKQDFFVSFSVITGILGAFTFLYGENVLNKELMSYAKEISNAIYAALARIN